MIDVPSYTKAKADWETIQEVAQRRFQIEQSRRAFLQVQAARITHNVHEMERLEKDDSYVRALQPCNAPGEGGWPYA